ncbi:hypothetical protein YC2023_009812 [Brassica napus]
MEIDGGKKGKGVALVSQESDDREDDDDLVSMLVRRFDKVLRRAESGQRRGSTSQCAAEGEKETFESEKNDHKVRREIKCYKCKGIGHTQLECVNDQKRRREKSMIGIDEIDSEEDSDEEELANVSSADGDDGIDYQELCQTVVQIDLKKENEQLVVQIEVLVKHVKNEKARSSDLNAKLEHHYKTVRMLTGSKELDKILSLGRQDQTPRSQGYTGYGKSDTRPIKFVPSSNSEGRTTSEGTTLKTVAEKVKNHQKVLRSETQQEK